MIIVKYNNNNNSVIIYKCADLTAQWSVIQPVQHEQNKVT